MTRPDDEHVASWNGRYAEYIAGTEPRSPERCRAEAAWYRDQASGYSDPRVRAYSFGMAEVCEAAAVRLEAEKRMARSRRLIELRPEGPDVSR